jgi:hypothetical protein
LESRFYGEINKRLENIQVKNVGRKEKNRRIAEKIKRGKNMSSDNCSRKKLQRVIYPKRSKYREIPNDV